MEEKALPPHRGGNVSLRSPYVLRYTVLGCEMMCGRQCWTQNDPVPACAAQLPCRPRRPHAVHGGAGPAAPAVSAGGVRAHGEPSRVT